VYDVTAVDTAKPVRLVRAVGLRSLTAIAINGIIGAGIFVLPAAVARILGPASLTAYLVAGFAVFSIALCFAEAGSRFTASGGPFIYARAAFGNFVGFQIGWMFLLSRLSGMAAVTAALSAYLGYFWPSASMGTGRLLVISGLYMALTIVNVLGLRESVWLTNALTIAKLLPLCVFCAVGLFSVDPTRFSFVLPPPLDVREAGLVLIFAFGGFEFASVPADEVINPRKTVPLAIVAAVAFVSCAYFVIHVVAQGTLPELASSATPLASASQLFLGAGGAAFITWGAVFSMAGTSSASMLVGSRMIFALGKAGAFPKMFGWIHHQYLTPWVAVCAFSILSWSFAATGSFAHLAALSSMARLIVYGCTCAAVPVLRRRIRHSHVFFVLPGGMIIPTMALILCMWLITGVSTTQALTGAAAFFIGTFVYAAGARKNVLDMSPSGN
jgi:basic amino acid/polyamine antiporter, APA family